MGVTRSVLIGLSLFAMACGGGGDPAAPNGATGATGATGTTGATGNTGGTGSTSTAITVNDNNFEPNATTVPVNSTITWTWAGSAIHNVTFATSGITSSPDQSTGTFQKQFPNAGVYNYSCGLHAGMSGRVTVQ